AAMLIVAALCFTGCQAQSPATELNNETEVSEETDAVQDTGALQEEDAEKYLIVINDKDKEDRGSEETKVQETEPLEVSDNNMDQEDEPLEAEEGDGYDPALADKHVRLRLKDTGYDVFAPVNDGKQDYRYSPSIMLDDNGGIDAWFASPGDGKEEYDWVTYAHSDDGGSTWTDEKVVLSPTPCTADLLSICDPDAFYYDGYYYLGYTSTIDKNQKGLCNSLFLARSQNPDGPYEKWNGHGWGGAPVPIVYFDGIEIGWGCGEPSFVILDDTIYVYSTKDSYSGVPNRVRVTEIRTGDLKDPMWPARLTFKGYAGVRNDLPDDKNYKYDDSDSWDVAYLEQSHKFIALSTNRRFKDDSCLLYYESDDGISFERVSEINTNVYTGCHNSGIMSDKYGHIKKKDPVMVGYAYSGSGNSKWGIWATRFAYADIDYTDEIDREEDGAVNLKLPMKYASMGAGRPLMLRTGSLKYTGTVAGGDFDIEYYVRDNYRNETRIDPSQVKIERYDDTVLRLSEGGRLSPIAEGMSIVSLEYMGLRRDICVCVLSEACKATRIRGFYPVCETYDLKVKEPHVIKVRPMAVFENYDIRELGNTGILGYGVTFSSSNPSVASVLGDGTVTPISPGSTVVTARTGGGIEYSVNVNVTE
ncbi:MAG: Ig-like domain-containing protein, partial [Lachnospiraceae bacterium]|nr:Ig-like domain-containing protein [Lachnospiraceae bacterium]